MALTFEGFTFKKLDTSSRVMRGEGTYVLVADCVGLLGASFVGFRVEKSLLKFSFCE